MSTFAAILEALSGWIDRAAAVSIDISEAFRARRLFQLIEQKDGSFVLRGSAPKDGFDWSIKSFQIVDGRVEAAISSRLTDILRGTEVDLLLQSNRFMVRTLELPGRASEFLDGIVRAQIDRLTPWNAANAAFGWHPSTEASTERIVVTIVATSRTSITPCVPAAAALGADMIAVSAALQEPLPDAAAIKIFEQKVAQQVGQRRVRRVLSGLIDAAGALSAASLPPKIVIGRMIEARRAELPSRLSERRAAMQLGHDRASDAVLEL